ncbi:hydrogenase expression/formation protein HypE [Hydrogenobaculum acidophilum]
MYVKLSHGGGAKETRELIEKIFLKHLKNELLTGDDATIINIEGKTAITTDSFTVSPIFFKGGDIGKLSVAGVVNDLSVMGAKPLYVSMGFILEEGLSFEDLERIVISIKEEASKTGIKLITADTKVVPKGFCDKIYINATGIGKVVKEGISSSNLKKGDIIIVSGPIGNHGATILALRNDFDIEISSDCASLWEAIEPLLNEDIEIHAMRDLTRGGLASVINEFAKSSKVEILLSEEDIPIEPSVRGFCEILGIEPYSLACEGTFLIAIPKKDVEKAFDILKSHKLTKNAKVVGEVIQDGKEGAYIKTLYGSTRYLEEAPGEMLPRIC